ncbi:hypothetical protein B0A55_12414 [Friedmanniomyces simplex]|uniref:Aminoglycoside phosphotransferase domain-containing protein n=1 Tax=Friedmanniomyces simplex TaxID=329884 RepID=A0A4U0W264_9PEZI|nr:hypothetical protein B0A55_12414 [Friedmanniomyces simplex]
MSERRETERGDAHTSSWKGPLIALLFKCLCRRPARRFFRTSGGVLFVSSRICIKSTYRTCHAEAHAMEFVTQNTSIPVPKVYFVSEHKGRVYIVMQRIKGSNASYGWGLRSEASKQNILRQLKRMIEELRNLPPPTGVGVANVDRGPIYDLRLPNHFSWGPFRSVAEFHRALADGQDIASITDDKFQDLQELALFYDQPWTQSVFTHGDLSSFNILCRGDDVVGIVDWETAGWLPPYWEYVTAWNVNPRNPFWQAEVDKFLTPLPYAQKMDEIRRKYFGLF